MSRSSFSRSKVGSILVAVSLLLGALMVPILTPRAMASSPDYSGDYSDYVLENYYSPEQIHKTWIDMDNDGVMDPYENTKLSPETRAWSLVANMTVKELIDQMAVPSYISGELSRLGIPPHHITMEALHGVAGDGQASDEGTVFPINVGLGATWDVDLLHEVFTAIGREERAHYNEGRCAGLHFFSPAVLDPMRDARWQRFQESFGEDPYHVARMGVATIRGFQGEDDNVNYRLAVACTKHFPSNWGPLGLSGPADERTTREVTFVPYKAAVMEADVGSVMACYYYRHSGACWDGTPSCYSKTLLTDVLRNEWGFDGYVVSDGSALERQTAEFGFDPADALKAGLDLDYDYGKQIWEMGSSLEDALKEGRLDLMTLYRAAERYFKTWFECGMFDPPSMVPYSNITGDIIGCAEHTNLALQAARESIVLLKNEDNILPLSKGVSSIAVIGPSADKFWSLGGAGYTGTPPYQVPILNAARNKVSPETIVRSVPESLYGPMTEIDVWGTQMPTVTRDYINDAVDKASSSDVAVVVLGPPKEGESINRGDLSLPENHLALLQAVENTGTPTIMVLTNASPLSSSWVKDHVPGIIEAWYPGMEGGNAIADVLFGDYNPGGKLPFTYSRVGEEPLYYNHKGEITYDESTYLWPFGYGLSYTSFEYDNLNVSPCEVAPSENVHISVHVKNAGDRKGDEVVQLYLRDLHASVPTPVKELKGFVRVTLEPGEEKIVKFTVPPYQFSLLNENLDRVVEPGKFKVMIGKSSEDIALEDNFEVTGLMKFSPSSYGTTRSTVSEFSKPERPRWFVDPDDEVGLSDLMQVAGHFGESGAPGWIPSDVDGDGEVGLSDLMLVAGHFGETR